MKHIAIFSIIIMLVMVSCTNHKSFIIKGTVPNTDSGAVRLLQPGESFFDSKVSKIIDHKFEFDGVLNYPEEFSLIYEKSGPTSTFQSFNFFVDPGSKIKIVLYHDSISSSKITGGITDMEFRSVQSILDTEYLAQMTVLQKMFNTLSGDSIKQDSILRIAESINKDIQNWKLNYIKANAGSIISANLLFGLLHVIPDTTINDHFKLLDKKFENSKYYKSIEKYLSVLPGNHYVDFTLADSSRTMRRFSQLAEGKVTLIDFWASWCKPCRVQNESLVRIYDQFRDHRFEIVGVSIDRDTSMFKTAIVEDKMTWVNLMDITTQESVSNLYRSNTIPANFLIDEKGIIIAKDIPMDKLYTMIDSLLNL